MPLSSSRTARGSRAIFPLRVVMNVGRLVLNWVSQCSSSLLICPYLDVKFTSRQAVNVNKTTQLARPYCPSLHRHSQSFGSPLCDVKITSRRLFSGVCAFRPRQGG